MILKLSKTIYSRILARLAQTIDSCYDLQDLLSDRIFMALMIWQLKWIAHQQRRSLYDVITEMTCLLVYFPLDRDRLTEIIHTRAMLNPTDLHLLIDTETKLAKLYDSKGDHKETFSVISTGNDACEYYCGDVIVTSQKDPISIWQAFGKYYINLLPIGERRPNYKARSPVGIHGGQRNLSKSRSKIPSANCIRLREGDVSYLYRAYIEPLKRNAKLYVTVR